MFLSFKVHTLVMKFICFKCEFSEAWMEIDPYMSE